MPAGPAAGESSGGGPTDDPIEEQLTATLIQRPAAPGTASVSRRCRVCGSQFDAGQLFCPHDGGVLVEDLTALVSTTLDGLYAIEALVGRGGMGAVYRARHILLQDRVAIKVLSRDVSSDPVWLGRFQQEGRAARRFRHPNAVAVHDLRTGQDGMVYLVLEYVEGRTLRKELQQHGPMTAWAALRVLEPIASALDAAHASGVVHRDLKPENVMLADDSGGDPVVKVLDFGIAKLAEGTGEVPTPTLTRPGFAVGTVLYMSPEQWGEPSRDGNPEIDGRADIYSLGVMAYEMVSGTRPFAGDSASELWRQHVSAAPAPLHELVEGLPEPFARAVARAMAKDRGDRQARAGEFVAELRAALEPAPATGASGGGAGDRPAADVSVTAEVVGRTSLVERPANNLPQAVTSFVGRRREISELHEALAEARLLTLAGPGGIGKTRLALEVAAGMLGEYRDGVWFVELAALHDPALVPGAVASTLGVRDEAGGRLMETLCEQMRKRQALLVLDNCEHLVRACADLAHALLRASPGLRVLATSREALGIGGETIWRVPALSVPDAASAVSAERMEEYEAVRLFVDRVRLTRPGYRVTEHDAPAIQMLCRRLDGIPLAIELAAARAKMLSIEQILSRLDDRFRLLTGGSRTALPRQQTLQAAIDWSYDLLNEAERLLLRRLSIFVGGWTLEAAEAVCPEEEGRREEGGGPEPRHRESSDTEGQTLLPPPSSLLPSDVLDLLGHLVDKSLVVVDERDAGVRYSMLESIRQYARGRLREAGEEDLLVARHREHFVRLAERVQKEYFGPDEGMWLARLEADHDNLRAVLQRSMDAGGDADVCMRMCGALGQFWETRGYLTEGRKWLAGAITQCTSAPASLRAKVIHLSGTLAYSQGEPEQARQFLEEGLALRRALGDTKGVVVVLFFLGAVAADLAEYDRGQAIFEEGLALSQETGHRHGVAQMQFGLAMMAMARGEYDRAEARLEESLDIYRQQRNKRGIEVVLYNLAEIAQRRGDNDRAEQILGESMPITREVANKRILAYSQMVRGAIATDRGEYERARALQREAQALALEISDKRLLATVLEAGASTAAALGQPRRALRLAGAASRLRETIKAARSPSEQALLDRHLDAARRALGPEQAERAVEEGRILTLERATDYAVRGEAVEGQDDV